MQKSYAIMISARKDMNVSKLAQSENPKGGGLWDFHLGQMNIVEQKYDKMYDVKKEYDRVNKEYKSW